MQIFFFVYEKAFEDFLSCNLPIEWHENGKNNLEIKQNNTDSFTKMTRE